MPLTSSCSSLKLLEDSLLPSLHATTPKSPRMAGTDSSDTSFSCGSSTSASSNGEDSSLTDIDCPSPGSTDARKTVQEKIDELNRLVDALRTEASKLSDIDSEACLTDSDEESFPKAEESIKGLIFDDGQSEIISSHSIPIKDVHRKRHRKRHQKCHWAPPDDEYNDDETVYLDAENKMLEDQLTRLGYIRRLSDYEGLRHYRLELDIDKVKEKSKVRTALGTIDVAMSNLEIFNCDGLQPTLASDLEAFNNGSLEIKKSPVAGYGAFAVRDLEPFTTILIERELFKATSFDLYHKLEALTGEQYKAYYNLYGYMRTQSEDIRAAIWRTNRFSVGGGCAVLLVGSRFNHACKDRSNVDYSYDNTKGCMVFATKKKIAAGSELFICYSTDPRDIFPTWGFQCACGGCKAMIPLPWSKDDGW
ncbi:hypothetical protein GGR51DRAFT_118806 [Nemania sp. FL0031]|nr:hypothetical protein GGR51DRAFT_118806 [Nemania sp. FL0031]